MLKARAPRCTEKVRQLHFTIASSISRSPVPFHDRQLHFTIVCFISRSPVPFHDRQFHFTIVCFISRSSASFHRAPIPSRAPLRGSLRDRQNENCCYLAENLRQFRHLSVVKQLRPVACSPENFKIIKQLFEREAKALLQLGSHHDEILSLVAYIDQLWRKYSSQRFGFSIQTDIYEKAGEDYNRYFQLVGWKKGEVWVEYNNLVFNDRAPIGQFPHGGKNGYSSSALFSRIKECQIW